MGEGTRNISLPVYAARRICRTFHLPRRQVRDVTTRVLAHGQEIAGGYLRGVVISLRRNSSLPKTLTPDSIEQGLSEGKVSDYLARAKDRLELMEMVRKNAVPKVINLLQSKLTLTQNLATAESLEKVHDVICSSITMEIADGAAVYRVKKVNGRWMAKCVKRKLGDFKDSSYSDLKECRGEKAWPLIVSDRLNELIRMSEGKEQWDYIQQAERMLSYYFADRKNWIEVGMTESLFNNIASEMNEVEHLGGLGGNNLNVRGFVKAMIAAQKTRMYMSPADIVSLGEEILGTHLKKIALGSEEATELRNTCSAVVGGMIEISEKISKKYYAIALTQAGKWALENRNRDFENILDQETFEKGFRCYVEGQEDITGDLRYLKKKFPLRGYPDIAGNYYDIVWVKELRTRGEGKNPYVQYVPVVEVLANRHARLGGADEIPPIFGTPKEKALTDDFLKQINPVLAIALLQKEADERETKSKQELEAANSQLEAARLALELSLQSQILDTKHAQKLQELSGIMIEAGENNPLEVTLESAERVKGQLLRIGDEPIATSILKESGPNEMEVVATSVESGIKASGQDQTIRPGSKINKGIIVEWIIKNKKDVFIFDGKIYINGLEQTESDLLRLNDPGNKDNYSPGFYEDIIRIREKSRASKSKAGEAPLKRETLMCAPIILGGDQVWVSNIRGAELNEKNMATLRSATNILSATINRALQAKELKQEKERFEVLVKELEQANKKLADSLAGRLALYERLETQSRTDELTQLLRRIVLEDTYKPAVEKTLEIPGDDLSIFMIDIDHFKAINDTYGHKNGDIVLQQVAAAVKKFFGEEACRYGGEECFAWKRHYSKEEANKIGEELRAYIEKMSIQSIDGKTIPVTVSIGIASLGQDYDPKATNPIDSFIDCADIALYGAKELKGMGRGEARNQCWVYSKDVAKMVEEMRKKKKAALDQARETVADIREALAANNIAEMKRLVDQLEQALNLMTVK